MRKNTFRQWLSWSLSSTAFRLMLAMIVITIPMIGFMIYNTVVSRQTLLHEVQETHVRMLESYCSQMQSQMNAASDFVVDLVYYDDNSKIIHRSNDEAAVQYASGRIQSSMDSILKNTDLITGYFLISEEADGYRLLLNRCNYRYPALTQAKFLSFWNSQEPDDTDFAGWLIRTIGGESYLYYCTMLADGEVYGGCYLRLADFLSAIDADSASTGGISFLSADDLTDFSKTLAPDSVVAFASLTDQILLFETYPKETLAMALPFLQRYAVVFITVILLLFFFLNYVIWRQVVYPILRLASSMHTVEDGDLDYRLSTNALSTEFAMLHNSFNRMLDNIQHLTIDVYQEQLKVQKAQLDVQESAMREQRAQLRNLQLQIKPHFLINSLNMIYNLIETKNLTTAQKLIKYTAEYFRYMTRIDEDLVPLNEEIDHIRSYLEIQSLRYRNAFSYEIQTDPMVEDMLIPPMTLQNYVENSIKYALRMDPQAEDYEPLTIRVSIKSFEKDLYPYARIEIRDNGNGYPEEMLAELNSGQKITKKDGSHIGLRNTIQRLSILFENQASWHYENDHGAVAVLTVPVTFEE